MRLAVLLLLASSIAAADPKVAVIERAKFEEPDGIARLLAVGQQLELEKKSFRYVESPDGKPLPAKDRCKPPVEDYRKKICAEFAKLDLADAAARAWKQHELEVRGAIETEIAKAISTFAKSRGIELVLEKDETGIVYLAPGVDITAAFIKDFNAKYPSARPAAKQSQRK